MCAIFINKVPAWNCYPVYGCDINQLKLGTFSSFTNEHEPKSQFCHDHTELKI